MSICLYSTLTSVRCDPGVDSFCGIKLISFHRSFGVLLSIHGTPVLSRCIVDNAMISGKDIFSAVLRVFDRPSVFTPVYQSVDIHLKFYACVHV